MTALPRRRILSLVPALVLVLALGLAGCGSDDPAPTPSGSSGGSGIATPSGGRPAGGGGEGVDRAIDLVPAAVREDISPLLVQASKWPADADLGPVGAVEEIRISNLIGLAQPLVDPKLFPDRPAAALGQSGDRVFLRLGNPAEGVYGQVSREFAPHGLYTVTFRWTWAEGKDMDLDAVFERLASVSSDLVDREVLAADRFAQGHPTVNAADGFQATCLLDRDGVGAMYPHVVVFADRTSLVAIYQQVFDNQDE